MFRRETPRDFYPPGYDPTLNRPIPNRVGCGPLAWIGLIILIVLLGATLFLLSRRGGKQTVWVTDTPGVTSQVLAVAQLATQAPTSTLDNWSLTGTAIFFTTSTATPTLPATMDYCWFLTPLPATPLPTIFVTADHAQLLATRAAMETGTPTLTPTPTNEPPRAWCNAYLAQQQSATVAPSMPSSGQQTATAAAWPTAARLAPLSAPPTWTPRPPPVLVQGPPAQPPPAQATSFVQAPAPPPQVFITQVYVQAQPQIIVITATLAPTNTATVTATFTDTATVTATFTDTATNTATATSSPTSTPSDTSTNTPTSSPTATSTDIPTDVPTPTPTFTDTATDTPTPTFTFTPTPTDTEVSP